MAKKRTKSQETQIAGFCALLAAALVLLIAALSLPVDPMPEKPDKIVYASPEGIPKEPAANPYGPTDFQYDGDYLRCIAGESSLGVDVSDHQGEIDWQQVRAAGVEFAMIRVGFRGYESGRMVADECAAANLEGALAAGLKVGVYFFSQAVSVDEALEEANFVLKAIEGWQIDMPVVFDWEYVSADSRTGNVDAKTLNDCTLTFCRAIEAAGFKPMVYFNLSQAEYMLQLNRLTDFGFWLAMYTDRMDYPYKLDMWQYTCSGTVPGIATPVDLDLYLPYPEQD